MSWRSRPVLSILLRLIVALLPALAAAGAAYAAGRAAPAPEGPRVVMWWLLLLALASVVGVCTERLVRRVIPLAVLLQLSLAFPDRAPSRFAIARTAGNLRQLEGRIEAARERGVDDDPTRAARQILEMVAALSAHDRKTRGHSERVRAFTDMLAAELPIDHEDRDRLRWAALLHDIGKLRVPPRILNKPGKPDPHEWERLKEHPEAGARLAGPLLPWLGDWAATIPQHHERFDGGGYPRGLAGSDISLGARIVSVADSFEVMTATRAYKRPMSVVAARRELAACAAAQFDPDVVRSFLNISLGKLWWTIGPASWLAATPVLGGLQRATSQALVAAKAAAVAAAFGVAGAFAQPTLAAPPSAVGGSAGSPASTVGSATPLELRAGDPVGPAETQGRDPWDDDVDETGDDAEGADPEDLPDEGSHVINDAVGATGGVLGDVTEEVGAAAGQVGDDASEAVDDVVDDASDVVDDAARSVGDLIDPVGG